MQKQIVIVTLVVAAVLAAAAPALAAIDTTAALEYLRTQQNADGGFGSGFSPDSSLSSTADAVLAIVATGGDLAAFDKGGNTPLTYLAAQAPSAAAGGDLAKLILAATAAGENPRQLGGVDSVAKLEALIGADGRIGGATDTFFGHCLAVLALKSAERPIPAAAVDLIKTAQQAGGGWAWDGSAATAADTNTTAVAVQALAAAGEAPASKAIAQALSYYQGIQNEDGGWPYQSPSSFGTTTDANSTAVTIQAILAAGQDPAGAEWTTATGQMPVAALEALQNPSGAFAWQATVSDDNLLATVQALPALAGKPFPLATIDVGPAAAPPPPDTIPVTGGPAMNLALPLILTGLGLASGGYALRRKR
ncbi:MAG: cell wall anchor protein [Anaerolineae bacterium]|nr:cell wall anchor protein [Anaerolineae bacterium]